MNRTRLIAAALGIALLAQGCFFARIRSINNGSRSVDATPTVDRPSSTATSAPPPTPTATIAPTATEIPPTALPPVHVTAINGNLNIRRGPGTPYDRIGVLKNGTSADVIGRDVLTKWVQINIPDTDHTGWVSLLTPYSGIDGDLSLIPSFTFTEWPEPAYIKNCTEHDLYIMPNGLSLLSLWTNGQYLNEVQVDPGVYDIYDLFVPSEQKIQTVDLREGETVYITVNGLGVKHNCP